MSSSRLLVGLLAGLLYLTGALAQKYSMYVLLRCAFIN